MPGARSPALLPVAGKQQVLLQLLQSLLNKVSGEGPVAGMDTLVSSTMLLLLTALRSTSSAVPGHRDIMGGAVDDHNVINTLETEDGGGGGRPQDGRD